MSLLDGLDLLAWVAPVLVVVVLLVMLLVVLLLNRLRWEKLFLIRVATSFRWTVWQAVRWKLLFLARPLRVWLASSASPTLATGMLTSMFRRLPLVKRARTSSR